MWVSKEILGRRALRLASVLPRPARWLPTRRALRSLALLVALCVVAFLANVARGALVDGLAAHEDEAGHVITGLMVRDWFAAGGAPAPVAFAQEYYLRYPKVGLGHWPPLFYLIQGLWTWMLGATQVSLVVLMSLVAGTLAWLLARVAEPRVGPALALAAALALLALPLVQWYGAGVLLELPLALACLSSALVLGAWIEAPSARRALLFGFLAASTALLKGNGLCLALAVPIALLLSGRRYLWGERSLWCMPLPVLLLCTPWYLLTIGISRTTWGGGLSPSLEYFQSAGPFYLREFAQLGGPAAALLALVGFGATLYRRRHDGRAVALASLVPAVLLFHLVLPSSRDERHLLLLAAPFVYFAFVGTRALAQGLAGAYPRLRAALLVALVLLVVLPNATLVRRGFGGYREALAGWLADPTLRGAAFLVSSDAIGDGLVITAAALGEPRGERVVLRATKSLARSNWMGSAYRERFEDSGELERWLLSVPVTVILLDDSLRAVQRRAHHGRLAAVLARDPGRWLPSGRFDVRRDGRVHPGALALYRLAGPVQRPSEPLAAALLLGQPMRGPASPAGELED